jgi:DNA polymerase III alpha subunit
MDDILCHDEAIKIAKRFKRKCPKKQEYIDRMIYELEMIIEKNLVEHILRVCDILDLLKNIPHIIRGSSGSSLVCYFLGITDIDPIEYNICFARFLNNYRKKLPDFDIDIPNNKHEYAFKVINKKWENKVARISNYVKYGRKSALRKAIKEMGYKKRVPKNECNLNFFKDQEKTKELEARMNNILGTFKNYSLHCGGIVFNDNGFDKELLLNNDIIQQVKYNKDDIEKLQLLKVDILSNRGLNQLFSISKKPINDYPDKDIKVIELLCNGKNIGLTFCESPGMKKILCINKPKSIYNLAECLSLIRPMANESKTMIVEEESSKKSSLKFDDDAIIFIKNLLKCSEGYADKIRRAFAKSDWQEINKFMWKIKDNPQKENIKKMLLNLRKYSFCKSHALSYAKLVWGLAYQKVYNPKEFWLATINISNTMYHKWVHMREAKIDTGLKLALGNWPYKIIDDTIMPVRFANAKRPEQGSGLLTVKGSINNKLSKKDQIEQYGYWIEDEFYDGCGIKMIDIDKKIVKFVGLAACGRWCKKWINGKYKFYTYFTIGYRNGIYIDIKINDKWQKLNNKYLLEGTGIFKEIDREAKYAYIEVTDVKVK